MPGAQRFEEGVRFPGTEVTKGWELPRGCWEQNPRPLEKHPLLVKG